jgi:hypothetical protein
VATFLGEICSVAFSSVALSSVSKGFFLASSESPASVPTWITAASISADFVSASVCAFEASTIFLEGVELKVFTVSNTSVHLPSFSFWGLRQNFFVPSGLLLLMKGLKFLALLFLQYLAFQPYLSQSST